MKARHARMLTQKTGSEPGGLSEQDREEVYGELAMRTPAMTVLVLLRVAKASATSCLLSPIYATSTKNSATQKAVKVSSS